MGVHLLVRAMTKRADYAHVSIASTLVLYRMALTALDNGDKEGRPAKHYFAGWKPLAIALGYKLDDDGAMTPTAKRAVARAVGELTACGLLGRADPLLQESFRHRVYVLRL